VERRRRRARRATLVKVLAALGGLGWPCDAAVFTPYVDTAERLAVHELDSMPADSAAAAVARIVLFEVAFAVLRRMAYDITLACARSASEAAPDLEPGSGGLVATATLPMPGGAPSGAPPCRCC
jgi:hypothetical protein